MNSNARLLAYRPDIDGLRAIAVVVVVLYHAGLPVPGGYVGVDVFFVISGYLIVSLILKELRGDGFSLIKFWERRARRIIPALAVVVLATLFAGWFLLLPLHYGDLGKSAAFLSVFCANFYFWLGTGYFAGVSEEKPLLHTWSLAVEEQFYFFIPLVLMGLFHFVALRKRGALLSVFGAGFLLSFSLSLLIVPSHPAAGFFLLPTRAWELLLGSIVAIIPICYVSSNRCVRETLSWSGVAGILIPCFVYTKSTPFPGLTAFPVCLGTAVLIWANTPTDENQPRSSVGSLLSVRPMVFIGLISYSLYLWHWPIIAYSNYWFLEPLSISYRIGMVIFGILMAVGSWHFVETPFRKGLVCATKKCALSITLFTLVAIFLIGSLITGFRGVPARLPGSLTNAFAINSKDDLLFVHNHSPQEIRAGKLTVFGKSDPYAPVDLVVWGDSHAMAVLPALDQFCRANGLAGRAITHSSTLPVFMGEPAHDSHDVYGDEILRYVRANHIPNIFLSAFWYGSVVDNSQNSGQSRDAALNTLQTNLLRTVNELVLAGSKPWILLQIPPQPHDVPKAMQRANYLGVSEERFCAKFDSRNGLAGEGDDFLRRLEAAGASLIDPRPAFLSADGSYYVMSINGVSLYRDSHHLSKRGAELTLTSVIGNALSAVRGSSVER